MVVQQVLQTLITTQERHKHNSNSHSSSSNNNSTYSARRAWYSRRVSRRRARSGVKRCPSRTSASWRCSSPVLCRSIRKRASRRTSPTRAWTRTSKRITSTFSSLWTMYGFDFFFFFFVFFSRFKVDFTKRNGYETTRAAELFKALKKFVLRSFFCSLNYFKNRFTVVPVIAKTKKSFLEFSIFLWCILFEIVCTT